MKLFVFNSVAYNTKLKCARALIAECEPRDYQDFVGFWEDEVSQLEVSVVEYSVSDALSDEEGISLAEDLDDPEDIGRLKVFYRSVVAPSEDAVYALLN